MSEHFNRLHRPVIRKVLLIAALGCVWLVSSTAQAQRLGRTRQPGYNRPPLTEAAPKPKPLPTDKRLLALHVDFVKKAMALAEEYKRKKEVDKAIDCYEEIVKLVPSYTDAHQQLGVLRRNELSAQTTEFEVRADKGWQSTGITLIPGKPISIRATGAWTFSFTQKLGPDGIPIPEELRDYNLGCLVGMIDTGDPKDALPFVVGAQKSFVAEKTGKLYLRMYNSRLNDSTGSLKVQFLGRYKE